MSELSEKDKALKAVLTMWNAIYNPPEFHILPNDIYKARKLLEEIIEKHYQSANAGIDTSEVDPTDVGSVGWAGGPTFGKGEYIKVLGIRAKITRIDTVVDKIFVQYDSGDCDAMTFPDARRGNPDGSFIP